MSSENICLKFTLGLQILERFLPSGSNASILPFELKGENGCKFKLCQTIKKVVSLSEPDRWCLGPMDTVIDKQATDQDLTLLICLYRKYGFF